MYAHALYRRVFWGLVILVLVMVTYSASWGQTFDRYNVRHFFRFTPPPATIITGAWQGHYCHAWVRTGVPPSQCFAVDPAGQPVWWRPYGRDLPWRWGVINGGGPATVGWGYVPPTGYSNSWNANCSTPGGAASASSSIYVAPYAISGPVWGQLRSWGWTYAAPGTRTRSYAFSWNQAGVIGIGAGGIIWGPHITSTSGSAESRSRRRRRDPIDFVIADSLTNDTLMQGTLLSIEVDVRQGTEGDSVDFHWEDNEIHIGAQDIGFTIDLTSPYVTSEHGTLTLQVQNGVVSEVGQTGIFSSAFLPSEGEPVPIDFPLDTLIEFDFELPAAPAGYHHRIDFGGSGEEFPTDEPEQVPAITEWGVMILVLLLLAAGAFVIRRRKAMAGA